MAICISCGRENAENAKFCTNCGAPMGVPAAVEENIETGKTCDAAEKIEETVDMVHEAIEQGGGEQEALTGEPDAEMPTVPVIAAAPPVQETPGSAPEPVKPNFTPAPAPAADPDKPGKKSKWGIISTWGYVGIDLLMAIPVIGFILAVVWACGGCRKYAKRDYARSRLIYFVVGIVLMVAAALILRFVFPEIIVEAFEMMFPGYTIMF